MTYIVPFATLPMPVAARFLDRVTRAPIFECAYIPDRNEVPRSLQFESPLDNITCEITFPSGQSMSVDFNGSPVTEFSSRSLPELLHIAAQSALDQHTWIQLYGLERATTEATRKSSGAWLHPEPEQAKIQVAPATFEIPRTPGAPRPQESAELAEYFRSLHPEVARSEVKSAPTLSKGLLTPAAPPQLSMLEFFRVSAHCQRLWMVSETPDAYLKIEQIPAVRNSSGDIELDLFPLRYYGAEYCEWLAVGPPSLCTAILNYLDRGHDDAARAIGNTLIELYKTGQWEPQVSIDDGLLTLTTLALSSGRRTLHESLLTVFGRFPNTIVSNEQLAAAEALIHERLEPSDNPRDAARSLEVLLRVGKDMLPWSGVFLKKARDVVSRLANLGIDDTTRRAAKEWLHTYGQWWKTLEHDTPLTTYRSLRIGDITTSSHTSKFDRRRTLHAQKKIMGPALTC